MDTECEEKQAWDFRLEKNLVFALGWSSHLCFTQRPLFYVSNSELGPYGVSSDHPMYNTP